MSSRNIAVALALLLGLAVQSCRAGDAPLLSLTMEHFRDTATVTDDPIAGVTTVATEKGYVERHGLLGTVWNDEYLAATIDRKAGRRTFEVIVSITYRGARRAYGDARFQEAGGPVAVPAVLLKTSAVNCPTGECTYTDHVSFPVEEAVLRAWAARYTAGKPEVWHYRLAAKSGGDYTGGVSSAEIAGFLAKVDEFTGAVPLPVIRPAAGARPELGIGGLHVDAAEQLPARGGVLVTAVSPGYLAQKAGIIVGDIVCEIDGHPIKNPPDLQTALAAAPAEAAITIKVYRGIVLMTLTTPPN
jgi:hypothetical protein